MSRLSENISLDLRKALTLAEYKKKWFDLRIAEIRKDLDLSDAQIGKAIGKKRPHFHQILNAPRVSDEIIDLIRKRFKKPFTLSPDAGWVPDPGAENISDVPLELREEAQRVQETIQALLVTNRDLATMNLALLEKIQKLETGGRTV